MPGPLNILIVEDSPEDAELILATLHRAGFVTKWKRVETEPDFLAEVKNSPDIILSDFAMPQFTGLRAVELLSELGADIPFILISGTVGEDVAVEAMRRGATDYLLKDRLGRLGNAIKRALAEKSDRAERKRAEAELRESELKFRQIAENIAEVFWITDPAKKQMIYVSPAYEKIWGRSCDSLYQAPHTWLEAVHPGDRERIHEATTSKQGHGVYNEIYRIVRPDGTVRWIHDCAFPIRNEAGEVCRLVGTAEDITERQKLQEQFLQAQKLEAVGQLAGGVAHDFNNILAVIQLQASLMGEDEYLSVEQKNSLDEIVDAARRAANLTRQLLLFSRREKIQPRHLDLSESISNVAKMLRRVLGEHIQMHFKFAPQPLLLHADPGMIDQILMNLVVNSRDAMPNGGTLIVETSAVEVDDLAVAQSAKARPGSFVCLRVSDTGCGITPENLERIFEPFFTTKEVGKGTGLGLATVFGIVAQHRGWIDVFSEPARGTTFRIYFPRLLGTVAHPEIETASTGTFRGNGETILLLEDDASLRHAFKKALLQLGYRVLEAARGVEALESWQQNREDISLLLADLVIPGGMNGMECAQQLLRAAPNLKIIYMSGYSEDISPADLRIGPGICFLAKPFDSAALAQTVRSALDAH